MARKWQTANPKAPAERSGGSQDGDQTGHGTRRQNTRRQTTGRQTTGTLNWRVVWRPDTRHERADPPGDATRHDRDDAESRPRRKKLRRAGRWRPYRLRRVLRSALGDRVRADQPLRLAGLA